VQMELGSCPFSLGETKTFCFVSVIFKPNMLWTCKLCMQQDTKYSIRIAIIQFRSVACTIFSLRLDMSLIPWYAS
jgi:hypothetical protein